MNQIVPPLFLFRWSFAAKFDETLPHAKGRLLDLSRAFELPSLAQLAQQKDFASVKLAWNNRGFGLNVTVSGRTKPPECVASEFHGSDGIRLWIDTRNTQSVHRATRFCHHFGILPSGGGPKRNLPLVRSFPVARAREDSPLPNVENVQLQSEISSTGYSLDAWFPAETFVGFDPKSQPRIGFHYFIYDTELGHQTLAVDRDFPFESDPSLWQTVELTS